MANHYFDVNLATMSGPRQMGILNAFPTFYRGSANDFKTTYAYNNGLFDLTDLINSVALGDTLDEKILVLTNGNYARLTVNFSFWTGSTYHFDWNLSLYNADDTPTGIGTGSSGGTSSGDFQNDLFDICLVLFAYDDSNNSVIRCIYSKPRVQTYVNGNILGGSANQKQIVENWYNGSIQPEYNWTAWDKINGNNGQYRCNLTTIKDSSIGDLSGESSGSSSDFDRIAGQSDIWSVFLNTPYDTETTIAYSGNAYLTLELHEIVGQPTKTEFVFRFYGNTGTLLFQISFQYITGGDYPDKHVYLSFVYDDNEQAAVFVPVRVSSSGTYYWGYNISGLSGDDLLYVWMWLQMSGAGSGDPSNPYDTGSEDNGGGGGNPQHQDHLQVGGNPTYDGSTSGMFTCYLPTSSELEDIADFLWSSGAIDNARKYFNNFADNIIALYVLPYSPVNPPTKQFKVGGLSIDTLPNVKYVGSRFVDVNMGEYVVEPRWTSYLDYAPFTKFEIYLPGIGVQALDTDEIMSPARDDGTLNDVQGSTLSLTYKIDLLTGICLAYVKINGEVRYQFPGKLGFSIPITGQDFGRIITGFTTVAAGIAGGIAYGGIAAPLKSQAVGHLVGGEVSAAVAGTVNAMKPEVHRSGNLSCEVSSISYETPYLIRTSPNKPLLVNQEVFTGFPSYKSGVLSDFDGYTECIDAHVEGISCTETERDKILEWLRKGVIL